MKESYIHFELVEEKPKTNVYAIMTNRKIIESGVLPHYIRLGTIQWSSKWRQYVFTPTLEDETDWSAGCLTDIIEFMDKLKKDKKLIVKEES